MQSRRLSLIGSVISTAIGFAISLALIFTVLPAFGYHVSWGVTAIYTAAFIAIRAVRRLFNK